MLLFIICLQYKFYNTTGDNKFQVVEIGENPAN